MAKQRKQVVLISGLIGSQEKLRDRYDDFDIFEKYSEMYGIAQRLGYKSNKTAWRANPTIQSGVISSDLAKVGKNGKRTPAKSY